MKINLENNELTLYTIGHSNHPIEYFLEILHRHKIEVIVDVRSSPYSKHAPQYYKELLQKSLLEVGVKYIFLGDAMGGMPNNREFYDDQGYVLYDRIAQTSKFKEGAERIVSGIKDYMVALLCGEEDPTNCHRRLLIASVLQDNGVKIRHIRGDGKIESEETVSKREHFRKTKGQMSLFKDEEKKEWKSTQSVLLKKEQKNSSESSNNMESND